MGFIREYKNAAGDPFSLRRPKWLKKIKPGRSLKKLASLAAPFIPGVGGIAAQLLTSGGGGGGATPGFAGPMADPEFLAAYQSIAGIPGAQSRLLQFARSYGYDVGDPGRRTPKRKIAASGPKAKATQKSEKRAARASGKKGKSRPRTSKRASTPIDWGAIANAAAAGVPIVGGALSEIGSQIGIGKNSGPVPADLGIVMGGGAGRRPKGMGFGGHRRTMNVLNVKALRRSARRLEGFQKQVKKIERLLPARARTHTVSRSGGHRHGCRCAVCKRAA